MAPSYLKLTALAATIVLLASAQQAPRVWAMATTTEAAVAADQDDMVPVSPAETLRGGDAGTLAVGKSTCLQCRCCSRSSPGNCQTTGCCSTFNCDASGKCNLVQKCGCSGCGGAH